MLYMCSLPQTCYWLCCKRQQQQVKILPCSICLLALHDSKSRRARRAFPYSLLQGVQWHPHFHLEIAMHTALQVRKPVVKVGSYATGHRLQSIHAWHEANLHKPRIC